ncbi:MAG: hypothetical protein LBT37_01575 [Lactobacillaceae bacterium]|nr:hypothetical protein [Lactobacillaceae bacterium]
MKKIKKFIVGKKSLNLNSANFLLGYTWALIFTQGSHPGKWWIVVTALFTIIWYGLYYYADYEDSDQRPAKDSNNDFFL